MATYTIFGASGDLTSRKLIPALYELFRKQRLPAGTKVDWFFADQVQRRPVADGVGQDDRDRSSARVLTPASGSGLPRTSIISRAILALRPISAPWPSGWTSSKPGPRRRASSIWPRRRSSTVRPVAQLGAAGLADESHGIRRIVIEKPFGTDLATARQLNAEVHRVFPGAAGLPDRSLPGQGDGAEHPGAPVRQRDSGADLEPQLHRPRADHRGRGGGRRPPRRLLRPCRRGPRHVSEPSAAAPDGHGDGAAGPLRGRGGAE